MRLGGTKPIQVDVRIIAATNKVLKEAVAKGEFREDLYYRLNVVPLFIPPLRERREDILPLALDIMQFFNKELKKNFVGFTPAAAELLQKYPWPGNIRELRNVIERTMILSKETEIDEEALPEEVRDYHEEPAHEEMLVVLRRLADRRSVRQLAGTGRPLHPRSAERHRPEQNPRRAHPGHPSHLAAAPAEENPRTGIDQHRLRNTHYCKCEGHPAKRSGCQSLHSALLALTPLEPPPLSGSGLHLHVHV